MNWDALGAIAELLGAIAVIASLLYLGRQIQVSNRQSKAQTFHLAASEQSRVSDAITNVPENFAVWMKLHDDSELSPEEYTRARFMISRVVQAFLAIEIGHENGQIGHDFYEDSKLQFNTMLGREYASVEAYRYLRRNHPAMIHRPMFEEVVAQAEAAHHSKSEPEGLSE
ncbi:MAG: hypothetical protein NXH85_07695 [Pseudomonadaceae bacterium]|nr:hypothetical protein [Pseudomonadaceae bacterium]